MKKIISIFLIFFFFYIMVFANDFIVVTEVKWICTNSPNFFSKPIYKYSGEKVLIQKNLIKGAMLVTYDSDTGLEVTEIQKKGKNIFVYETPEEIYKLLKD